MTVLPNGKHIFAGEIISFTDDKRNYCMGKIAYFTHIVCYIDIYAVFYNIIL